MITRLASTSAVSLPRKVAIGEMKSLHARNALGFWNCKECGNRSGFDHPRSKGPTLRTIKCVKCWNYQEIWFLKIHL